MALVAPADIDAWIGKSVAADKQAELVSCVEFAQAWVASEVGIRSLEKESAAKTIYVDGERASGEWLFLPANLRPVWHTGSDTVTVTENGTSVSSGIGYSTTVGAILKGVNSYERVSLYRSGGWSTSLPQNVAVTCKVGFDSSTTASTLPVPFDVQRLVAEVAWLKFNAAGRVGLGSVSKVGSSSQITNELSQASLDTLDRLRVL